MMIDCSRREIAREAVPHTGGVCLWEVHVSLTGGGSITACIFV